MLCEKKLFESDTPYLDMSEYLGNDDNNSNIYIFLVFKISPLLPNLTTFVMDINKSADRLVTTL